MNLGYEDTMTEIYSVDSQYSKDGGVVVQVTGALQAKGKDKRPFVQTFFLAVQEKGYYVLNDIFRYLLPPGVISEMLGTQEQQGEDQGAAAADDETSAPASAEKEESHAAAGSTSSTGAGASDIDISGLNISDDTEETPSPSSTTQSSAAAAAAAATTVSSDKDATSTTTTITKELQRQTSGGPSAVPAAPGVTVPFVQLVPGEVEGGTAGVNGVSIVYGAPRLSDNSEKHSSGDDDDISSATPKSAAAGSDTTATRNTATHASNRSTRPPPPPPRPEGSTSVSVSSIKSLDSPGPDSMEPPPTEGVFIRDIPQAVTLEQLAEALSQYGPIAAGSLSLKTQQNRDSYAFVDYQHAEDAADCLANGMEFYGKKVTVETKRPHIFKSSGGGANSMRSNNNMNSHAGSLGMQYPTSPMHMQYPTSPMHLQSHVQYQQYQRDAQQQQQQHNARVSNGSVGLGAAGGGYTTNTRQQHMSNGGNRSTGGTNSQMHQQMHQRNTLPTSMQSAAAAYQMAAAAAAAGGYPMMMYNPATMGAMPGMTYVQIPPNQAAMMMAADTSGTGGVAVDGGYGSVGAGMQMGNRVGGGRGNVGNGRYDANGGRAGGGGGRGGGSGAPQRTSADYARGSLGQPMPYS